MSEYLLYNDHPRMYRLIMNDNNHEIKSLTTPKYNNQNQYEYL